MLLLEAPFWEQSAAKAESYNNNNNNNNNNNSSSIDSHPLFTSLFRRAENTLLGTNGVAPPDPTRRNRRHARCSSFRTTAVCKSTSDSVPTGNRAAGCCCYAHYTPAFRVDYQACVRQMVVGSMEMGGSQERKDSRSIRSANVNDSGNGNGGNSSSRSSNGAQDQKPNIPPTNDRVDEEEEDDEKAGDADQDDGNSDEDDDDEEEDDDDDEEDGDDGVVRCVCGERNDGELMIECEICQVWQHTLCMGIRDEAHIPDKYYCEKCRPEDHPYINSRPRTLVLAEASALGTSTMMRRSAVMAVAKMTAREEYRSAAAAAAIAASVAAASSSGPSSAGGGGGGRKTPRKQARRPNGGTPSSTPRSTQRNRKKARRQSQRADGNRSAGDNEDDDDDLDAGDSEHEYARGTRAAGASRSGAGTGGNEDGDDSRISDIDDDSNGSGGNRTARSRSQRQGLAGSQRSQKSKRSSVSSGNTISGSKRRKATAADRSVAIMSPSSRHGSNSADGLLPTYIGENGEADGNESSGMEDDSAFDNGVDDPYYASEDVVARMLGARINDTTPRGKARTPKSRTRSVSTVVKSNNTGDAGRNGLAAMASPTRQSLKQGFSTGSIGSSSKRRGKSVPGSPRLGSRSPSPTLQSLLYDEPDSGGIGADAQTDAGASIKSERTSKRRRTGGGGGGGSGGSSRIGAAKHKRMTVSATNSPYLGNGSVFGSSGGDVGLERHRGRAASSSATALADSKGKSADVSGGASAFDAYGANDSESAYDEIGRPGGEGAGHHASEDQMQEDEDDINNNTAAGNGNSHSRQPKHKFPPLETTDIDGNPVVIPSHLLNNSGQPMYSSADTETMCKIRYPHTKTSVFELNRRAKQLLEWLGKMQSEYEHEAQGWIEPLDEKKCTSDGGADNDGPVEEEDRPASRQVSEAPTTPIDPANWPDEDGYDGGETGGAALKEDHNQPKRPRSTCSIMEDLVWRLIRFQETYST